jgi:hypothetical protein
LRKVFIKLDIRSRNELDRVLAGFGHSQRDDALLHDLAAVETRKPGGPTMSDLLDTKNQEGQPISDLLETVIEALGGLERWNQLSTISARLTQGGALWALKGQPGVLDDVVVTASLHEERASHRPFGAADRHSAFTPERVAIETDAGTVLETLDHPRASFAGHSFETPWSTSSSRTSWARRCGPT